MNVGESVYDVGDYVRVSGLGSEIPQHLCGCIGRIVSVPISSIKRASKSSEDFLYKVDCSPVAGRRRQEVHSELFVKEIKASNLQLVLGCAPALTWKIGDIVEIHGLQSTTGQIINNRRGELVSLPASAVEGDQPQEDLENVRFGVCIGSMRAKNKRDTSNATWLKSVKGKNLRLVPREACALLDLKQLAAEIVAECSYVWRGTGNVEDEYMSAYSTRHSLHIRLENVEAQKDGRLKFSVISKIPSQARGEGTGPLARRGEVFCRCVTGVHIVVDEVKSPTRGSGDFSYKAPWELLTCGESILDSLVAANGRPPVSVADVIKRPAINASRLQASLDAYVSASDGIPVDLVFKRMHGVPSDFDEERSDFQARFPAQFDIRVMDKVVVRDIEAVEGDPNYREISVSPHSTRCIEKADAETAARGHRFLLCATEKMQEELGGYEASLRLLSRVLAVGKCNEAAMIFCVLLQQFEPEIMPTFKGHVVYDVRIEVGGYVNFEVGPTDGHRRAPPIVIGSDFSSVVGFFY